MVKSILDSFLVKHFAALLGMVALCAVLPAKAQISTALAFQAPPMGSPGNREAGSGRSDTCASLTDQAGLTAIVPETNLGLTTKATPQLFAYIPSNNAAFAELRLLKDSTGEDVYISQVSMPPATTPGYAHGASTVSLSLPTTVALEPGEDYLWALMLVCNVTNRAEDIVVTAVVQRADNAYLSTLPAEVSSRLNVLNTVSDSEKLTIYRSAGLWQDLLAQLSALMIADPATYGAQWSELLTEQGLGAIADAPLYKSQLTSITSSSRVPQ
jgi:hypothetical protein